MQVRISDRSHQVLKELSTLSGDSIQGILEQAVESYRRRALLDRANAGFAALKADAKAWACEQEERSLWERTLSDGQVN
jgi:hypothetical protein